MSSSSTDPESHLRAEDIALLESLRSGGEWLRAILGTLARRGRSFRNADPERTRALLDALSVYPWYKGGQFLFDLMEWEDFLIDGPPPMLVPTTLDAATLSRLAAIFEQVRLHFDSATKQQGVGIQISNSLATDQDLPDVEPGMYLSEDVVLGIIQSVLPSFVARLHIPTGVRSGGSGAGTELK